jgi:putative zinc finger/helix-turn-helix YgiT family protein
MKGFCPSCEKETELVHVQRVEEINVKGELILVEVDLYQCVDCGEEFDNPEPSYDPLAKAYQEYRRRKGMTQPEEIKAFRKKYDLSQKELSSLLGFGGATLSRYENGTLQDQAHDTILRLILEPHNLLKVVEGKTDALTQVKREQILKQLKESYLTSDLFLFLRSRESSREPNILNGYRTMDFQKILQTVKVLIFGSKIYKTKLNKLLFYADFKHFKENVVSITGLNYAHLPYGPVPDQYELLYESLLEADPSLRKEEDISQECTGEFFVYEGEPDHSFLTMAELNTLLLVKEFFKSYSSKRITEFSHNEPGYQATSNGDLIPYSFAENLRI